MLGFVFKSKLSRLNPDLYVDDSSRRQVSGDWWTAGLYSRRVRRSSLFRGTDRHYLDAEGQRYAEACETGQIADFILGVPQGYVPEYDVYCQESGRLLARGWRSILLALVDKRLVSLDRARRVFGCASLGETPYDRANFAQKRQMLNA